MKLEFLTEARSEFLDAVDYYEEKQWLRLSPMQAGIRIIGNNG
jgi:hypothetical protein